MCGKEECGSTCKPASPARVSTKRKQADVADSTPTPFSTAQPEDIVTPTEAVSSVDGDDTTTSSTGIDEDTTEDDCVEDDTKKEKKKRVRPKRYCTWSDCKVSRQSHAKLKEHVDFKHNKLYHNECDLIDKTTGEKCGFRFETRNHLTRHQNSSLHNDVRDYPCPDCELRFTSATHRKEHWDTYCSPPGDPVRTQYKCPMCNEGFPTSTYRNNHHLYTHVPKDDPKLAARRKAQRQCMQKRRTEDRAERGTLYGGAHSKFGQIEGVSRAEEIEMKIGQLMNSPAGIHHPEGAPVTAKWTKRHGNATLRDVFMNSKGKTYGAYIGTTVVDITPGEEEKCPECRGVLHRERRDPLVRIETSTGDLRLFTGSEAGSVIETFVLATSDNRYDITCLEGEMQYYLEDMGMPHGIRLHRQAGAGSRLPGSESVEEKKRREAGKTNIYSLFVTLVEMHDPVFTDEVDPSDPTPTIPRLLSATVVGTKKGKETVFNIAVRGHKQPHPATPSVLKDREKKQQAKIAKKARKALKLATTPTSTADCAQEPPSNKKQKTGVV
ncbi:hypothetical protein T484DRAFT_1753424 [Baffinella frigidus]|nr:hypothetical protein T484DRAFT_1753424 [Cryptophyta sp. CCMP2293]